MRDHFRRDVRFHGELAVSSTITYCSIAIVVNAMPILSTVPMVIPTYMTVTVAPPLPHMTDRLFIHFIALIPGENVGSFTTNSATKVQELLFMMPNIQACVPPT